MGNAGNAASGASSVVELQPSIKYAWTGLFKSSLLFRFSIAYFASLYGIVQQDSSSIPAVIVNRILGRNLDMKKFPNGFST